MDGKEITSKEKVLAVWPDAFVRKCGMIYQIARINKTLILESGSTPELAWDHAAAKLPAVEDRSGQEPQDCACRGAGKHYTHHTSESCGVDPLPATEGQPLVQCEECQAILTKHTGPLGDFWLDKNNMAHHYCGGQVNEWQPHLPAKPPISATGEVELPEMDYRQEDWDYADAAAKQAKEQRSVARPSPATVIERMAVQLRGAWASVSCRERQLAELRAENERLKKSYQVYNNMILSKATEVKELYAELSQAQAKVEELTARIKPKCPDCNATGLSHCSDPVNCGGVYWPDHMYRSAESKLQQLREGLEKPLEVKHYPAHGAGFILFYSVADIDAWRAGMRETAENERRGHDTPKGLLS